MQERAASQSGNQQAQCTLTSKAQRSGLNDGQSVTQQFGLNSNRRGYGSSIGQQAS
jgi:hypothetical protein